jgi:hypothetical protein
VDCPHIRKVILRARHAIVTALDADAVTCVVGEVVGLSLAALGVVGVGDEACPVHVRTVHTGFFPRPGAGLAASALVRLHGWRRILSGF